MFSYWLGAASGTCKLAQRWQWISEYSGQGALAITVVIARDLCSAFLRPRRGVFRIQAYLRDTADLVPDYHNKANISIQQVT